MGTKMITKETASKIAYAYSEIEAGEELLKILDEALKDHSVPDFRDGFGRNRALELGVPCGPTSKRLFTVNPKLGMIIVKAHIAGKRAEIEALCEIAKQELGLGDFCEVR